MRLIDADALKARIMMDAPGFMDGGSSITKAFIMAMVGTRSATPTIDAVPVVRCKFCTYRNEINCPQYYRRDELPDDYFCADGRKCCVRCGRGEVEAGRELCPKCLYEMQNENEERENRFSQ